MTLLVNGLKPATQCKNYVPFKFTPRAVKNEAYESFMWPTLLAEPFFCLLDLVFSRKALHESSKIFIEYALHVARIQSRTQA